MRHSGRAPNDDIADIGQAWQPKHMTIDLQQVALDWIAYACFDPNDAPDEVFVRGWVLYDLVEDDPSAAWEAIKLVAYHYPEEDFYSQEKTEAQRTVGNVAAGPLEDLLSAPGSLFLDAVESEARRDRRMAWTLGGVWQSTIPDDAWARLQKVADSSYWRRPAN